MTFAKRGFLLQGGWGRCVALGAVGAWVRGSESRPVGKIYFQPEEKFPDVVRWVGAWVGRPGSGPQMPPPSPHLSQSFEPAPSTPNPMGGQPTHISMRGRFPPQKAKTYMRPEVPIGILVQPFWHPPPPPKWFSNGLSLDLAASRGWLAATSFPSH